MNNNKARMAVSAVFILLAVFHIVRPDLGIDLVTVTLIFLAVLPWLLPFLKTFELPGGFRIELRDAKSATDKASDITLQVADAVHVTSSTSPTLGEESQREDPISMLRRVAESDANLAFVGFRIEIEKRLRRLAEKHGIDAEKTPLRGIVRTLKDQGVLAPSVVSGLDDLIALGNQAAHGATVAPDAAEWLLDVGPSLLDALDNLVASAK